MAPVSGQGSRGERDAGEDAGRTASSRVSSCRQAPAAQRPEGATLRIDVVSNTHGYLNPGDQPPFVGPPLVRAPWLSPVSVSGERRQSARSLARRWSPGLARRAGATTRTGGLSGRDEADTEQGSADAELLGT